MGRMSSFFAGVLVGAAAVFGSLKYHVVRAEDGFHLVPKMSPQFQGLYVDIRQFSFADWDEHRGLAAAILQAQKGYLLKGAAVNGFRRSLESMLETLSAPRK